MFSTKRKSVDDDLSPVSCATTDDQHAPPPLHGLPSCRDTIIAEKLVLEGSIEDLTATTKSEHASKIRELVRANR